MTDENFDEVEAALRRDLGSIYVPFDGDRAAAMIGSATSEQLLGLRRYQAPLAAAAAVVVVGGGAALLLGGSGDGGHGSGPAGGGGVSPSDNSGPHEIACNAIGTAVVPARRVNTEVVPLKNGVLPVPAPTATGSVRAHCSRVIVCSFDGTASPTPTEPGTASPTPTEPGTASATASATASPRPPRTSATFEPTPTAVAGTGGASVRRGPASVICGRLLPKILPLPTASHVPPEPPSSAPDDPTSAISDEPTASTSSSAVPSYVPPPPESTPPAPVSTTPAKASPPPSRARGTR